MRTVLIVGSLLLLPACSGSDAGAPAAPSPSATSRGEVPPAAVAQSCVRPSSAPLEDGAATVLTMSVDSLGRARVLDLDGGRYQVPPGPPLVPGDYPATVTRDGDVLSIVLAPETGGPAVPVTLVGPLDCG